MAAAEQGDTRQVAALHSVLQTTLPNCTYRYPAGDILDVVSVVIDGPLTSIAAMLALVGARFALRFLQTAGLNPYLTAALYMLCVCDSLLMITIFFSYGIEATAILLTGQNVMWRAQALTSWLHGVSSSLLTGSTLLVVYISARRFLVVARPMRYARAPRSLSATNSEAQMRTRSVRCSARSTASMVSQMDGIVEENPSTTAPLARVMSVLGPRRQNTTTNRWERAREATRGAVASRAPTTARNGGAGGSGHSNSRVGAERKSSSSALLSGGGSSGSNLADCTELFRHWTVPVSLVCFSFLLNIPVFLEISVRPCFDLARNTVSSCPFPTTFRAEFMPFRPAYTSITQTVGPVAVIAFLTATTEYLIYRSLRARRRLFESQRRARSAVIEEQLKERISRTVAIFIAIKFMCLRLTPLVFDIWENMHGIANFGTFISILVRVSDFAILLNSATNSLAYFGKQRWLEKRLRQRMLRREQKREAASSTDHVVLTTRESALSQEKQPPAADDTERTTAKSGRPQHRAYFESGAAAPPARQLAQAAASPPPLPSSSSPFTTDLVIV